MPAYKVTVRRTEDTEIEVIGDNDAAAGFKALKAAVENQDQYNWTFDDIAIIDVEEVR